MKFERISLEKYGAISSREIDLASKPGLIIVYGPNEAGKSTLLNAIRDLLYGVPHTSPHGAVFGNDKIRISATLRLSDGSELRLRRKKGRPPGDLVDGNDAQFPASRMEAILGGTDRDRFNALFGLDHGSLREGGQKLLASDGEIGRLIVEAGGGLRTLVSALAELEAEADALFSSKKSKSRKFYGALEAFMSADKEVKGATTSREAFVKAQKAAADAASARAELIARRASVQESISRYSRLKQNAPQFQLLATVEAELAAFSDIEELSDELGPEIAGALAQRDEDATRLAAAEEALTLIADQLGKFSIAIDIVDAAAEIEAVETTAVLVEKARLDLPKRRAELAESNAQLDNLRALLGVDAASDLERTAPSRSAIEDVQSLASEAIALNGAIASAKAQFSEYRESLDALTNRQSERETRGFNKPAQISAAELMRLAPRARDLELKQRQIVGLQASLEEDALALGLSPSELKGGRWPTPAQVRAELDHESKNDVEMRQAESAWKSALKRGERAARMLADLEAGSQPPTPTAVALARSARDQIWSDIRSCYLDPPDEEWSRPSGQQRSETATEFESKRDAADHLVDKRGDEAQRVADIVAAERDKLEAAEDAEGALRAINDIRTLIEDRRRRWSDLWPEAVAKESNLHRLLALTETRDALIGRQGEIETLRMELIELKVDSEHLETLLDQIGGASALDTKQAISARVQRAIALLKAHDDQYGDYRRSADDIEKLRTREQRAGQEIRELTEALEKWSVDWSQAVAKLGLADGTTPGLATEVATEWVRATGVFSAMRLTTTRIQRIEEDEQRLKTAISELRKRIAVEAPEDAVSAARHLNRLLEESIGRKLQSEALQPQFEKARLAKEATLGRSQASEVKLASLASRCSRSQEELIALVPRFEQRRDLRANFNTLKKSIVAAGDGHSFESLKEQLTGLDPDRLSARLVELEDELTQLERQSDEALTLQKTTEASLKAFVDGDRLNSLVADREVASAEMHEVIERYIEITIAKSLLNAAIEKVRNELQDPLLARASELFSVCTRSDFVGIGTDVSEDGEPIIIGLRADGGTVHLSEMSDGTRDQLFLAFRLASIEHYARNAEPLPLIADDILVHFDDTRGQATLNLLAEIGSSVQVLLFTHHKSVSAAASGLIDAGRAAIVEWC